MIRVTEHYPGGLPENVNPIWFECFVISEKEYDGMPLLYSEDEVFEDYYDSLFLQYPKIQDILDSIKKKNKEAREARETGNWKKCLKCLHEALLMRRSVFDSSNPESESALVHYLLIVNDFAAELQKEGYLSKAFELLKSAEETVKKIQDPIERTFLKAILKNNLANYFNRRKKRNAAASYASDAFKLWKRIGMVDYAYYFLLKYASAICSTGRVTEAFEKLSDVFLLLRTDDALRGKGQVQPFQIAFKLIVSPHVGFENSIKIIAYHNLAVAQIANRKYNEALISCGRALEIASNIDLSTSHIWVKQMRMTYEFAERMSSQDLTFDKFKMKHEETHVNQIHRLSKLIRSYKAANGEAQQQQSSLPQITSSGSSQQQSPQRTANSNDSDDDDQLFNNYNDGASTNGKNNNMDPAKQDKLKSLLPYLGRTSINNIRSTAGSNSRQVPREAFVGNTFDNGNISPSNVARQYLQMKAQQQQQQHQQMQPKPPRQDMPRKTKSATPARRTHFTSLYNNSVQTKLSAPREAGSMVQSSRSLEETTKGSRSSNPYAAKNKSPSSLPNTSNTNQMFVSRNPPPANKNVLSNDQSVEVHAAEQGRHQQHSQLHGGTRSRLLLGSAPAQRTHSSKLPQSSNSAAVSVNRTTMASNKSPLSSPYRDRSSNANKAATTVKGKQPAPNGGSPSPEKTPAESPRYNTRHAAAAAATAPTITNKHSSPVSPRAKPNTETSTNANLSHPDTSNVNEIELEKRHHYEECEAILRKQAENRADHTEDNNYIRGTEIDTRLSRRNNFEETEMPVEVDDLPPPRRTPDDEDDDNHGTTMQPPPQYQNQDLEASIKIQSRWRGYQTRKEIYRIREELAQQQQEVQQLQQQQQQEGEQKQPVADKEVQLEEQTPPQCPPEEQAQPATEEQKLIIVAADNERDQLEVEQQKQPAAEAQEEEQKFEVSAAVEVDIVSETEPVPTTEQNQTQPQPQQQQQEEDERRSLAALRIQQVWKMAHARKRVQVLKEKREQEIEEHLEAELRAEEERIRREGGSFYDDDEDDEDNNNYIPEDNYDSGNDEVQPNYEDDFDEDDDDQQPLPEEVEAEAVEVVHYPRTTAPHQSQDRVIDDLDESDPEDFYEDDFDEQ